MGKVLDGNVCGCRVADIASIVQCYRIANLFSSSISQNAAPPQVVVVDGIGVPSYT